MSNINNLQRVLTAKGYAIKKSSLTSEETIKLRKDLTVSPVSNVKYAAPATQAFPVYLESPTRFYIPRMYGREHYGREEANTVAQGAPLPSAITFKGKPYDYQENIINTFIERGANGLICVPCGKGKTFMALYAAVRLGKRFLVVVDKEFLLNQWKGEIAAFIGGSPRIGVVQGPLCQTDPAKYDITICMIQTISSRDFPEDTFAGYGFTIFDECHHLGAAYFSRTLMKIQTAAQLGLSATPTRDDGLTKVFEWYLGPPVYWEKIREADKTVTVRSVRFSTKDPLYNQEQTDYRGELVMARILTQIVECDERNVMIVKLIRDLLKNPHRKVLVLSERIAHLKCLEAGLLAVGVGVAAGAGVGVAAGVGAVGGSEVKIGYYVGGMKEVVREKGAKESRVLLASYSMASEAMNIKELNAVVLASPRKKVEQSTGRILRQRKEERNVDPVIVDVVDSHGIYVTQWRKRFQYYKQCGYKIERSSVGDCDIESDEKDEVAELTAPMGCLVVDD
jgi:superfamily II DNA or RNA helicase